MKILCISGKARHGKDTVAEIMKQQLTANGYRVLITHYADLLKYICGNFFGWNGRKDECGRQLLQYVGTDKIRKVNPDYWVDFLGNLLEMFHEEWDYVIIPDCRFGNEIYNLRHRGFNAQHIRVFRPDFDNGLTEEQKQHPSETALDDTVADFYIANEGSMWDLRRKVNELLMQL